MSARIKEKRLSRPAVSLMAASLLLLSSLGIGSSTLAGQATPVPRPDIEPTNTVAVQHERDIRYTVNTFLWAISNRHAPSVWYLTGEDHQASLGTEAAALTFFSRIHPQLVNARSVTFDAVGFDQNGAHATFYVTDTKGQQWFAWFAVEQDPVGDWKIVGCRVRLAPGKLA